LNCGGNGFGDLSPGKIALSAGIGAGLGFLTPGTNAAIEQAANKGLNEIDQVLQPPVIASALANIDAALWSTNIGSF